MNDTEKDIYERDDGKSSDPESNIYEEEATERDMVEQFGDSDCDPELEGLV